MAIERAAERAIERAIERTILAGEGGSGGADDSLGGAAPGTPVLHIDFGFTDSLTLSGDEITAVTDNSTSSNDMSRATEGPDQLLDWQNGRRGADLGTISALNRGLRTTAAGNPTGFADAQDWTVAVVADLGAVTATPAHTVLNWANSGLTAGFGIQHNSGLGADDWFWGAGANMNVGVHSTIQSADAGVGIHVLTFEDSIDNDTQVYLGPSEVAVDTDDMFGSTGNPAERFYIGGDASLGYTPAPNCVVGEIIVYSSLQSLTALMAYLNTKWAVY